MRTIGNPEEFNQKMVEVINTTKNAKGIALNNLRRASNIQKSILNYARDEADSRNTIKRWDNTQMDTPRVDTFIRCKFLNTQEKKFNWWHSWS